MPDAAYLHIRARGSRATRIVALVGPTVRIGRGRPCEVRLEDPRLAEVQCLLRRRGEAWHLQPLGVPGPLTIDGRSVEGPRPLPMGTTLRVLESWLTLLPSDEGAPLDDATVGVPEVDASNPPVGDDPLEESFSPNADPFAARLDELNRWEERLKHRERWLEDRQLERRWEARWRAAGASLKDRARPRPTDRDPLKERPASTTEAIASHQHLRPATPPRPDIKARIAPPEPKRERDLTVVPTEPSAPPPIDPERRPSKARPTHADRVVEAPRESRALRLWPAEVDETTQPVPEPDPIESDLGDDRPATTSLHVMTEPGEVPVPEDLGPPDVTPRPPAIAEPLATGLPTDSSGPRGMATRERGHDLQDDGPAAHRAWPRSRVAMPQCLDPQELPEPADASTETEAAMPEILVEDDPGTAASGTSTPAINDPTAFDEAEDTSTIEDVFPSDRGQPPPRLSIPTLDLGDLVSILSGRVRDEPATFPEEPSNADPGPSDPIANAAPEVEAEVVDDPPIVDLEVVAEPIASEQPADDWDEPEDARDCRDEIAADRDDAKDEVESASQDAEPIVDPVIAESDDEPQAPEPADRSIDGWPSARSILGASPMPRGPRPTPRASRSNPLPIPTERIAPSGVTIPGGSWLCIPLLLAALAGGTLGVQRSWTWAVAARIGGRFADRIADGSRPDPIAMELLVEAELERPIGDWKISTADELIFRAALLSGASERFDPAIQERIGGLLDAARQASPNHPSLRFASAWRSLQEPGAEPDATSSGLSRDLWPLAWTGRTLLSAGKRAEAERAFAAALAMAVRVEPDQADGPRFIDESKGGRFGSTLEGPIRMIVNEMADRGEWTTEDWEPLIPESATACVVAARVLRDRGDPGADRLLQRAIALADRPEGGPWEALAVAEAMALDGRLDESIDAYRDALDTLPERMDLQRRAVSFNLADLYGRVGDDARERDALLGSMTTDPDDPVTSEAIRTQARRAIDLVGVSRRDRADADR